MDPKNINKIEDGSPAALGASFDGLGVNFAIHSKNATKVELCLFSDDGKTETARITLPKRTGDVWHGYVKGLKPGQVYGYRVDGPTDAKQGHRFNSNKVVMDPYAKEVTGEMEWTREMFDPAKDSAPYTAKARVTNTLPGPPVPGPDIPRNKTVYYEMHAKGFSKLNEKLPKELRGTYAGIAHPASIAHLKKLGVTSVELLPVHAKVNDPFLAKMGLKNYWGYNTLSFFAPEPEYASDPQKARKEFREMVNELHRNGIEVILDVVYNHAGEGNEKGPTIAFRGVDNATYYKQQPHDKSKYIDDTGCGNTIDISNPAVRKMIIDSLRHWVQEYGVDGFRFDLATVLGRDPLGYTKSAAFFQEIAADPVLSKVKLVAEPWDPGPGGYQLGNFPRGWAEWNDKYRDDVRKFWRGDDNALNGLATRVAGSAPEFDHDGRSPLDSVNFLTVHDGMTLHDVVSHSHKKNWANGENNRDGTHDDHSANYGAEGPTNDPDIIALRERQKRNMLATLFLSQGTPLLLAGDEHGNHQDGNNNAYPQDNATGWLNWEDTAETKALTDFTAKLIKFRDDHPVLSSARFMHGKRRDAYHVKDIMWFNHEGKEKTEEEWAKRAHELPKEKSKSVGVVFNQAAAHKIKRGLRGERLFVVFNSNAEDVRYTLPRVAGGQGWERVLDTSEPDMTPDGKEHAPKSEYTVPARSVVVFKQKR